MGEMQNIEDIFENHLILIGVFGIDDPIRPDVVHTIRKCKEAGVTLRMLTSDHLYTARTVALKIGLIDKALALEENVVIDGDFMKEYVGGSKIVFDEFTGKEHEDIVKKAHFKFLATKFRVLARCNHEVKKMVVGGLVESSLVAVTGSGIADVKAMQLADVGLCLGNRMQNEVAKDASDIVLLDDNFNSILVALMWGRVLYSNVRKFM
jgi:magnesium-transporting ATPase (P-type)